MAVLIVNASTGDFLADYDPDWQPDPPPPDAPVWACGRADWTSDRSKAMRFETHDAAFECWRMQSTRHPVRGDGRANRPLTAATISFLLEAPE